MNEGKDFFSKKWVKIISFLLILIFALAAIPWGMQLLINQDSIAKGSDDGWLGFWGGYLGAIIGVFGTYWMVRIQLKNEKKARIEEKVDNTFFNLLDMHQKIKDTIKEESDLFEDFCKDIREEANSMIKFIGERKIITEDSIIESLNAIFLAYIEKMKTILTDLNVDVSNVPQENDQKLGYLINQASENYEVDKPEEEENDKKYYFVINTLNSEAVDVLKLIDMIEKRIDIDNIVTMFFHVYSSILDFKIKTEANEMLLNLLREVKKYHNKGGRYELIVETTDKQKVINDVSNVYYSTLASYFRLTHRILKYINENVNDQTEKENYLGFLRATMDEPELLTLFYTSSLSQRGEGLKHQLYKTNFFGKKGELGENGNLAQHFNRENLFWPEEDLKMMQRYTTENNTKEKMS